MSNEKSFEDFYGIDTISYEENRELTDYFNYEATDYKSLIRIFDKYPLTPYDTLVDFGCGLGRVLFYCNQRFMCKVTGIEYDRAIYNKLCDNAEIYHSKFLNQRRKFSLLRMTAEEYIIEPTDNFFYFFNPFSKDILKTVLENIMESHRKSSRKITLIFCYCTFETLYVIRKFPFTLKEIIKLSNYEEDPDDKCYIYCLE